jgi:hypothetical protein
LMIDEEASKFINISRICESCSCPCSSLVVVVCYLLEFRSGVLFFFGGLNRVIIGTVTSTYSWKCQKSKALLSINHPRTYRLDSVSIIVNCALLLFASASPPKRMQ